VLVLVENPYIVDAETRDPDTPEQVLLETVAASKPDDYLAVFAVFLFHKPSTLNTKHETRNTKY